MKYFGLSDKPQYHEGPEYMPMARAYWGRMQLPECSKIIGGYSDSHSAGALIRLKSGVLVCGHLGVITAIG